MFGEDAVVEELVDGGAEITQVGAVLHAQAACTATTAPEVTTFA